MRSNPLAMAPAETVKGNPPQDTGAAFALVESKYDEPDLHGVTDGVVGTYRTQVRSCLAENDFETGNSASGIDFPSLGVDMKVTSITATIVLPIQIGRQKIRFGIWFARIRHEKSDDHNAWTGRLDIKHNRSMSRTISNAPNGDFNTHASSIKLVRSKHSGWHDGTNERSKNVGVWRLPNPDTLAREAIAHLKKLDSKFQPKTIIEPTCGVGAFLLAAADTYPDTERIVGLEIEAEYLNVVRSKAGTREDADRFDFREADFFKTDWENLLADLPEPS